MSAESNKYRYRLESLTLNDKKKVEPGALTVLIGPNNSGKSQALKDIVEMTTKGTAQRLPSVIVEDLRFDLPKTLDQLREAHPEFERKRDRNGRWAYHGLKPTLDGDHPLIGAEWPDNFEPQFSSPEIIRGNGWFSQEFGAGLVGFLTTENRLQLVKEAPSGAPSTVPNLLKALYRLPSATRDEVGEHIANAFDGQRVKLDMSDASTFRLRVGLDFSQVPPDPGDAIPFIEKYRQLDDQGDGIRSFTGIVVALTVLNRPLVLIDEPEAFLGPPQAQAIGRFIASMAGSQRQIVVATHSTDVLRGLLSETQDVKILRIDRIDDETNSFRELTSKMLKRISDNPLMNSARVLDALFYETTIVGEGDTDCRFYESAMRMLDANKQYHFVTAIGKQTVVKIMAVYDETGVRRAGIVDFDVLRRPREWKAALGELDFTEDEIKKLTEWRDAIGDFANQQPAEEAIKEMRPAADGILKSIEAFENEAFEDDEKKRAAAEALLVKLRSILKEAKPTADRWNDLKARGRRALDRRRQVVFDELSSLTAERGLFIVPTGALESLMEEHGVGRNNQNWLEASLSELRKLTPVANEQPWEFLERVRTRLSGVDGAVDDEKAHVADAG